MGKRLYEKICLLNDEVKARFCMPAHGGVGTGEDIYASARYDWTEACGLDNLLCSDGVIQSAEQAISQSMGYKYALMLTQGSSCGMHIAVSVAKDRAKTLLAVGDMHKSFYCACRLYGADIVRVRSVEELDSIDGKIGGVFVTSPDYFGVCKDLSKLSATADRLGAYLVVDEAHGAHFAYSTLLPDNASKYADISLMSMHKTLPVYGSGALVCVNTLELKLKCEGYRALIHSTSPNYLTMASMDYADAYMRKYGESEYAKVKTKLDEFGKSLAVGTIVASDDFSRLVVKVEGKDAYKAYCDLAQKGIHAEMAKDDLLVFIVTPFNCDLLDLLAQELNALDFADAPKAQDCALDYAQSVPAQLDGDIIYIDINKALGRVCAVDIGVYPPGAPFLVRGDVIDEKAMAMIKKYRNQLFGLASGRIAVIK